jgi:hypothetical protein
MLRYYNLFVFLCSLEIAYKFQNRIFNVLKTMKVFNDRCKGDAFLLMRTRLKYNVNMNT